MFSKTPAQIISYSVAVIATILFASVQFAGAQTWTPPAGPPPSNNAPAPIHEGQAGQGKGDFGNADYSIGALMLESWGLFSNWGIFDGYNNVDGVSGVASVQYCLGTPDQIASSGFGTPSYDGSLDCVTGEDGWGAIGGEGADSFCAVTQTGDDITIDCPDSDPVTFTPGEGGNANLPSGVFGSILRSFGEGGWQPTTVVSIDQEPEVFGGPEQVYLGNSDNDKTIIRGGLQITNPADILGYEDEMGMPAQGKILAAEDSEGNVRWMSQGELFANLESALPDGDADYQLLYWDEDTQSWLVSQGTSYVPGIGLVVDYGQEERFVMVDIPNCENNGVLKANGLAGLEDVYTIGCDPNLRVEDTAVFSDTPLVLNDIALVPEDQQDSYVVRNLCYVADATFGDELLEGQVIDCEGAPSGSIMFEGTVASYINSNTIINSSPENEYWDIPAGVNSLDIKACAGGSGGGGGSYAALWLSDNPGGGGGGGGLAGACESITFEVENPLNPGQLLISVGAGGAGGYGGSAIFSENISLNGLTDEQYEALISDMDNYDVTEPGYGLCGGSTLVSWGYPGEGFQETVVQVTENTAEEDFNCVGGHPGQSDATDPSNVIGGAGGAGAAGTGSWWHNGGTGENNNVAYVDIDDYLLANLGYITSFIQNFNSNEQNESVGGKGGHSYDFNINNISLNILNGNSNSCSTTSGVTFGGQPGFFNSPMGNSGCDGQGVNFYNETPRGGGGGGGSYGSFYHIAGGSTSGTFGGAGGSGGPGFVHISW